MSRTRLAAPGAVDLVIFDCDGVLIDSEVIACRVGVALLAEIGYRIALPDFMARFLGKSQADARAILERELGRPLPADFAERGARRTAAAFAEELRAMPGVETALARLTVPKCVASSSLPERLSQTLGLTGLARWFDGAVFSAAMVARGKPAPDLFLLAAGRMGAAPGRCVVIEDSAPGIVAAKAAGMTTFGFAGGSHCRPEHGRLLAEAGADLVFGDMRNLPALVAAMAADGQRKSTPTTS